MMLGMTTDVRAFWDEQAPTFDEEPDHGLLDPGVRAGPVDAVAQAGWTSRARRRALVDGRWTHRGGVRVPGAERPSGSGRSGAGRPGPLGPPHRRRALPPGEPSVTRDGDRRRRT